MEQNTFEVKHYGYIDSLRGLAILLVLAIHAGQNVNGLPPLAYFIFTKGKYGVQLFFIVSAFTLFLSYAQRLGKDGKNVNKFFFIRRFFRIAPAYYSAIIFYSILALVAGGLVLNGLDVKSILASVFFLNSLYPKAINYIPPGGWTVATEMMFYLFIPFLFSRIKNLKSSVFLFLGILALSLGLNETVKILALHFWHLKVTGDWFLYYWLPNQMPVFILGLVCYHILQKHFSISKLWANFLVLAAILWAAFVFFICSRFPSLPEHVLVSFSFCLFIIACSKTHVSLLVNKFTEFCGKISYSMYLIHFFITGLCLRYFPQQKFSPFLNVIFFYIIILGLSSVLAYASFMLIEERGKNWGKQLIVRLSKT